MSFAKGFAAVAAAFVVVMGLASFEALAADVRIGALTSTDAGSSNSLAISPKISVTVQCSNPACYLTGTGTLSASCSTDYVLPLVGTKYERTLDTGSHNRITARAVDAGNPDCQVYQSTKNPAVY